MMNNTLIKPAPTLNSKAPAKGAPKMKKKIDRKRLPTPIKVIIQTKFFAIKTHRDDNKKPINNMAI